MKVKGVNLDFESVRTALFMPAGFTGKWRDGNHYWMGHRWFGPPNRVGDRGVLGFKTMLINPEHRP